MFEIDGKEKEEEWTPAKNTIRSRRGANSAGDKMDVDFTDKNQYEAFWDMEDVPAYSGGRSEDFQCQPCGTKSILGFHRQ